MTLFQGTLKTLANIHKFCGETLPKNSNFLSLLDDFFLNKRRIYDRILCFQQIMLAIFWQKNWLITIP
jgi:hypothetical protein